ncbi:MAG: DinB family protein [Bacteroidia bacterium]|jgi:hypothetical protein
MQFSLSKSIDILERTPLVLETWLGGLSDEWILANEGPDTWNAFDIVGHLIHGEETDWITRMQVILSNNEDKTFDTFDRFAQYEKSRGKTMRQLLDEFKQLRKKSLDILVAQQLTTDDLTKTGMHRVLGEVTLSHLLATWVAHDLNHIAQIARVMAKQYKEEAGPWVAFLRILQT